MRSFLGQHKGALVAVALMAALPVACVCWYRHQFPYGYSHCCIKAVSSALQQYAETHDGRYPAGEASPEASLSLLHYSGIVGVDLGADTLRGKTVPADVVQRVFDASGLLGPETCGWHYVEGLTQNDDRRLALLWDKVGLGHNGQRWGGAHEVVLVGGSERVVRAEDWPGFLEEQERLLARRDPIAMRGGPILTAKIRWPSGELADHYDGPFELQTRDDPPKSGIGSMSSSGLPASELSWTRAKLLTGDRSWTWVLVLPDRRMRSNPVRVKMTNGTPMPSAIVFEMEETR